VSARRCAEGWGAARRDARRFLRLRGRAARVAELRARQASLARRVGQVVAAGEGATEEAARAG
jgi:hypothetical protein